MAFTLSGRPSPHSPSASITFPTRPCPQLLSHRWRPSRRPPSPTSVQRQSPEFLQRAPGAIGSRTDHVRAEKQLRILHLVRVRSRNERTLQHAVPRLASVLRPRSVALRTAYPLLFCALRFESAQAQAIGPSRASRASRSACCVESYPDSVSNLWCVD